MRFGKRLLSEPTESLRGAVVAHSLRLPGLTLKKGRVLTDEVIETLRAAGVREITVAQIEATELTEDQAARAVLEALAPDPDASGLAASAPFTGRANLYAAHDGLFSFDPQLVHAVNAIDEEITVATLPPQSWVTARRMLATVKIIPYGVSAASIGRIGALLHAGGPEGLPRVAPPVVSRYDLVLTRTEGFSAKLIEKGEQAVRSRMAALGLEPGRIETTPHETGAAAAALKRGDAPIALILAASATTDRRDVAPDAIIEAGGVIDRLGMPVDPGNLIALGRLGDRRVVALPGCARSPKLNGVDWVLERLVAGVDLGSAEIAAMGVGGLLKEIPSRPAARMAHRPGDRPYVSAILLAAGGSSRMGEGRHKLLEEIDGAPLLRRSAEAALASAVDEVIVIIGARSPEMRGALNGLPTRIVENPLWREGVASSIRVGLSAVAPEADAALILLADMPAVGPRLIDRLIAAFDPEEGREAARPVGADGRGGHPVLFGRRYFEALGLLEGDQGARRVVEEAADRRVDIEVADDAAFVDLDAPADWARWRATSNA